MLTKEQRDSFSREGWLRVPGVFTPDQVRKARAQLRPRFDDIDESKGDTSSPYGLKNVYGRFPELRWIPTHPPLVAALKSLMGEDFVLLRETPAHYNNFGSWHRDSQSPDWSGITSHLADDYLMVQVAIYLQDNHPQYAGGLEVVPGSHRDYKSPAWREKNPPGYEEQDPPAESVHWIPHRAGDVVMFDYRIRHRSAQPEASPPPEHEKLALFLACSRNNEHVDTYHNYLLSRPDSIHLKDFSYPSDWALEAKKAGLNLY